MHVYDLGLKNGISLLKTPYISASIWDLIEKDRKASPRRHQDPPDPTEPRYVLSSLTALSNVAGASARGWWVPGAPAERIAP